jgi:hypothetical protein
MNTGSVKCGQTTVLTIDSRVAAAPRAKKRDPTKQSRTETLKRTLIELNAQIVVSHDPAQMQDLLDQYVRANLSLQQAIRDIHT